MTTTNHKPRHSNRKPGSQFDQVCTFINRAAIGSQYTCAALRKACSTVTPQRLAYCHGFILSSKCIIRVKRGTYEVVSHIPTFVTYNMLEANRGFVWYKKNPEYREGDNSSFYISIPRGLKWVAGEPNPYLVTPEPKLQPELTAKNHIREANIKTLLLCFERIDATHCCEAYCRTMGMYVYIKNVHDLSDERDFVRCTNLHGTILLLEITDLANITISNRPDMPDRPTLRKEQIIGILKQGLSASAAADKILNLF